LEIVNVRALDKGDLPRVAEYLSHPLLAGLTGLSIDRGLTLSVDDITEGVETWRTDENGMIRVLEVEGAVVGHVRCGWWWDAFTPWLEIVVRPEHRNRGLGTTAGRWALDHLFRNTPAHVVHASTPDWNEDGVRLADRLGFERAGAMRRIGIRDGRYVDGIEFELLRARWEGTDAAER
jgi:RimJ/RimL family protein N-acetyltransferase